MAPSNLPECFNATSQDVEMLIAAQCNIGSKNAQVRYSACARGCEGGRS